MPPHTLERGEYNTVEFEPEVRKVSRVNFSLVAPQSPVNIGVARDGDCVSWLNSLQLLVEVENACGDPNASALMIEAANS